MEMDEYQAGAIRTAIYPEHGTGTLAAIWYSALGIAGEAGELANKAKKLARDPDDSDELRRAIIKEIGDAQWYLAVLCHEMGTTLGTVARVNLDTLRARELTNTLHGSGDNREQVNRQSCDVEEPSGKCTTVGPDEQECILDLPGHPLLCCDVNGGEWLPKEI